MTRLVCGWVVTVVLLASGASAQPGGIVPVEPRALGVGDEAPALRIGAWIKGDPVESFVEGRVYVVEFWATWCGPCVAGIPHLTEVQERFAEHATIVSVTRGDEMNTLDRVTSFVGAREEEMGYTVAFDDVDATWRAYMDGAGEGGIPCAFVVDKQGRLAWIGHPMSPEFEATIEAIVRDEFDLDAAARAREASEARRAALTRMQEDLHEAWEAGATDRAFDLADEIIAIAPDEMDSWAWWKFQALMVGVGDPARGQAFAKALMSGHYAEDEMMLRRLASGIVGSVNIEGADFDLALELAERAVTLKLARDADALGTLAEVRQARGEFEEAVAVLERAVDVSTHERMRAHYENELDFMRWRAERAAAQKESEPPRP